MDETNELIQRCQKGDIKAFELLFLKYKGLVFRNAILMIGNKEQAEDVLQDVFTAVWNSRYSFNPKKASFITWLHKITMNRCIDSHRREQLHQPYVEGKTIDLPTDSSHLLDEALINKLEYERLMRVVSRLDDKHRTALILRYFNDLSYKDIADVLGIPLGTVKSRIYNALCLLREQMSPIALENNTKGRRQP